MVRIRVIETNKLGVTVYEGFDYTLGYIITTRNNEQRRSLWQKRGLFFAKDIKN